MKKSLMILPCILFLTSLIVAQSIDISFPNNENSFGAGEPITFIVKIYDANNNPIIDNVQIEIKDSAKRITEMTVPSNSPVVKELGETAASGQGTITATYKDFPQAIVFFEIGVNELANFELQGDTLKITNVGNTPYSRTIKITIGDTTRTKEISLDVGKSLTYKLIAPNGIYNIKVEDGKSPSLIRSEVGLTGTGQAIGAIDNSAASRSPLTGVASPDQKSDEALLGYIKNNAFVYVFIIVIFAAMILLGIERRYKKRASK